MGKVNDKGIWKWNFKMTAPHLPTKKQKLWRNYVERSTSFIERLGRLKLAEHFVLSPQKLRLLYFSATL